MNQSDQANIEEEFIPTRRSLLSKLSDWNDQDSWKVFFDTYWKLIYTTAIRSGLSDAEAQDVVQETVISVSKSLAAKAYNSHKSSFKSWLLRLTKWRIVAQFRKRRPTIRSLSASADPSTRTDTIERIPDENVASLEEQWDREWETNLLEAATRRVKAKSDPKQYQIFDLYVYKQWPASRVAKDLRITRAAVYVAKHRVSKLLKKEIDHLKATPM